MKNVKRFFMISVTTVLVACLVFAVPVFAADPTSDMIRTAAVLTEEYGLPSGLLLAVAEAESGFDPNCKTGKCRGLMQIHSSYAEYYAKQAGLDEYDLFSPDDSMRIAAYILSDYLNRYDGSIHKALMCYNLGEFGAKAKWRNGVTNTGYSRKVSGRMEYWELVQLSEIQNEEAVEEDAIVARISIVIRDMIQMALDRLVE